MSWWEGTPASSEVSSYTPWIKAPSHDFSSALYSYLGTLIGQRAPQMPGGSRAINRIAGGQTPGGMNADMQNMMTMGKQYMNTGLPTVFGAGIGSLGRFLSPSFSNPVARLQMGAPNYFGNQPVPPLPGAMGMPTGGGQNPYPWLTQPQPQGPPQQMPPMQMPRPQGPPMQGFMQPQGPMRPDVAY